MGDKTYDDEGRKLSPTASESEVEIHSGFNVVVAEYFFDGGSVLGSSPVSSSSPLTDATPITILSSVNISMALK